MSKPISKMTNLTYPSPDSDSGIFSEQTASGRPPIESIRPLNKVDEWCNREPDVTCVKCQAIISFGTSKLQCTYHDHEDFTKDKNDFTIKPLDEVHYLCIRCVQHAGKYAVRNPEECYVENGIGLYCVKRMFGCRGIFTFFHMFPLLFDRSLRNQLEDIGAEKAKREIPRNLFINLKFPRCSFCKSLCVPCGSKRWILCSNPDCRSYQCSYCFRRATLAHESRTCSEMAVEEAKSGNFFHGSNKVYLKPPFSS